MKYLIAIYYKIRNYLARHKRLSLFMSHGGVHLLILCLLVIGICIMAVQLRTNSAKNPISYKYTLSDTLGNHEVELLKFTIKPAFKTGYETEHHYIATFSTKFYKKPPIITNRHFTDTALSNLPQMFLKRYVHSGGRYLMPSGYIEALIDESSDEELKSLFIYPASLSDVDDIRQYLTQRNKFVYDSLTTFNEVETLNERDFMKYLRLFLKDADKIRFYDSRPDERALRLKVGYRGMFKDAHFYGPVQASNDISELTREKNLEIFDYKNRYWDSVPPYSVIQTTNFSGYTQTKIPGLGIKFGKKRVPYFNLLYIFDIPDYNLNDLSYVDIDLSEEDPMIVYELKTVYPTPTYVGVNHIRYEGKEAVEQILRDGKLYIEAVDIKAAYQSERSYLVISVLLGTLIAFAIDVTVQLVYKWRKLT